MSLSFSGVFFLECLKMLSSCKRNKASKKAKKIKHVIVLWRFFDVVKHLFSFLQVYTLDVTEPCYSWKKVTDTKGTTPSPRNKHSCWVHRDRSVLSVSRWHSNCSWRKAVTVHTNSCKWIPAELSSSCWHSQHGRVVRKIWSFCILSSLVLQHNLV